MRRTSPGECIVTHNLQGSRRARRARKLVFFDVLERDIYGGGIDGGLRCTTTTAARPRALASLTAARRVGGHRSGPLVAFGSHGGSKAAEFARLRVRLGAF